MISQLERYFNRIWYQTPDPPLFLVLLSLVYRLVTKIRKLAYQRNLLHTSGVAVPVLVVGNLSVGGTGKTPLIIWLVAFLRKHGYHPGVISRGYGGQLSKTSTPALLPRNANPVLYGDEAVLIASRTACPVVIGKSRLSAARHLLSVSNCDIILSDDGLQHLALQRDIEILVVDGMRQFGNQHCLPAGPLREPLSRINTIDLLVCNGNHFPGAFRMDLVGQTLTNLLDQQQQPVSFLRDKPLHVVTGIGNPQRFFQSLKLQGLDFDTRTFPDHHNYTAANLQFDDDSPILMTEKDAVKCYHLANRKIWMLPVEAQFDSTFSDALKHLLEEKHGRLKTT